MSCNKSLNISLTYRKFYPHIQEHFQSEKAALLIGALEYWFSKEKFYSGFFKFLEPCSHRLCKSGDTWAEELGWKRDLFKRIFDEIGTRYSSKTAYVQAAEREDSFRGKLYACYYDRKTNRTFFVRNHTFVDALLHKLNLSFTTKPSIHKKTHNRRVGDAVQPLPTKTFYQGIDNLKNTFQNQAQNIPLAQYSTGVKPQSLIDTKINTYILSSKKSDPEFCDTQGKEEDFLNNMVKIWEETVSPMDTWVKSPTFFKRLKESFSTCFEGSLEKWQEYCRKIASSKFLMGEGTSTFKAWIHWAIKPETVARIEENGFTFGDRVLPKDVAVKNNRNIEKEKLSNIFKMMDEEQKQSYIPLFLEALWRKNPAMATAITTNGLRDPFHQAFFKDFVMQQKGLYT